MTAEKILTIARAEIGVKESPAGSNIVKYTNAYEAGPVAWCAIFIWWVFQQAGAAELYYGGGKTAYCPTLYKYHKGQGQGVSGDYRPGDIVFFNFSGTGKISHVGLCESWDGTYITTIDGNTGTASEANGGAVMRRRRHRKYIVGAYRPRYEEEMDLTEEQVRRLVREELERMQEERAALPPSSWAESFHRKALAKKIITDPSGAQSYTTKEEVFTMILKALNK